MTKRLYLVDPYITSFDADITEARETDDGPAVVFEATYFYPESGGQPFDLGTIAGIRVNRVVETVDGTVLHVLERLPNEKRVHCEIDHERRRDHMQQHSGQHILSAAFVDQLDANTTSFHLGAKVSTIDVDRAPLDARNGLDELIGSPDSPACDIKSVIHERGITAREAGHLQQGRWP